MVKAKQNKKIILIILVIVLVVIIVASIIIKNTVINKEMSKQNRLAGANQNSELIANNIKKGITIGGITGTLEDIDTSDANATPEDILEGKTAYVDGVKITGTRKKEIQVESVLINGGTSITQSMTQNDTMTLNVYVYPENATNKRVIWSSDAPNIASVDQNGKVTANRSGGAIITATSVQNPNIYAECYINVTASPIINPNP